MGAPTASCQQGLSPSSKKSPHQDACGSLQPLFTRQEGDGLGDLGCLPFCYEPLSCVLISGLALYGY